ncbi:putative protein frxA [Magnetofaba australis IT-1]|uniref:Hydrogenase maturation protease n=1 Tax=Magnetofaba australis IT-1 TaxID=1434232 RepID=A0A1Y2K4E8_9PROT|nr:putative protein frxA [Magnetofaba australis IT-1]
MRELGSDLLTLQTHAPYPRKLWIVDAARGVAAGQVEILTAEQWRQGPEAALGWGHHLSMAQALKLLMATDADFAAIDWRLVAIGVGDEPVRLQTELSPTVAAAAAGVIEQLSQEAEAALAEPRG